MKERYCNARSKFLGSCPLRSLDLFNCLRCPGEDVSMSHRRHLTTLSVVSSFWPKPLLP